MRKGPECLRQVEHTNGQHRYKYLVLRRDKPYFVKKKKKKHSDSTKKFSETNIIKMPEFLIDNIFVMFGGRVHQQTVGIPYGYKLFSSSHRLVPRCHVRSMESQIILSVFGSKQAKGPKRNNQNRLRLSRWTPCM